MVRQTLKNGLSGFLMVMTLTMAFAPTAEAGPDSSRASWLLTRGEVADFALTGQRFEQAEVGGGGGSVEVPGLDNGPGGMSGAWPVLMSLVLPGAGEVALGYKRGYFMAAADIFAWTQVAKYHNDGADLREAYYAFADEHYSDERLVAAYSTVGDGYRDGQGALYFPGTGPIEDVGDLDNLPLYVTKEADLREYYENLGKWDQFVFGWDDYIRPDDTGLNGGYEPVGTRDPDLLQPFVSRNRAKYRIMRDDSNQAYKNRDRWLYANIGLRLFSVFQVAYLQGLLGGGPGGEMAIGGHKVEIRATPAGTHSGSLSARVSF